MSETHRYKERVQFKGIVSKVQKPDSGRTVNFSLENDPSTIYHFVIPYPIRNQSYHPLFGYKNEELIYGSDGTTRTDIVQKILNLEVGQEVCLTNFREHCDDIATSSNGSELQIT